jgi:hypothetical protein
MSVAYPNPVQDRHTAVKVDLESACPRTVRWTVSTVGNRVVARGTTQVMGKATVAWDQRDFRDRLVANGVYYLRLYEDGRETRRVKVMVLR